MTYFLYITLNNNLTNPVISCGMLSELFTLLFWIETNPVVRATVESRERTVESRERTVMKEKTNLNTEHLFPTSLHPWFRVFIFQLFLYP